MTALLHKGTTKDPLCVSAPLAFEMGSKNGASALGLDSGELKRGKAADLAILSLAGPHCQPRRELHGHVAYNAQGSDVFLTMVDGKVLYKAGEFPTMDYLKIAREARKCSELLY